MMNSKYNLYKLYSLGLVSGWRSLLQGCINKETLRLAIVPLNYWRMREIPLALHQLNLSTDSNVLNGASPFLSSIAIAKKDVKVTTIDIQDEAVKHQLEITKLLGITQQRSQLVDMRNMPFEDGSFNHVLSISAMEHIPGNGDIEAAKEIARVLSPGGQAIITVPFTSGESYDEFRKGKVYERDADSGGTFFQRYYSGSSLQKRLISPSGFVCKKILYVRERHISADPRKTLWTILNHPKLLKPLYELISPLLYPFFNRPDDETRANPIACVLILEKKRKE